MRIWLATIGEPVPVQEGTRDRLHRTGYFAHFLAAQGHDVTWWTSAFDHFRKKHWFQSDTTMQPNDRLRICSLQGCGYRSNISLARFRDHRQIARKFASFANAEQTPPQVIVAALPTIELCVEAVKYGRKRGIPVVLDMRDMWPDIFVDSVPGAARPLAKLLLWPMFRAAHRACARATAITGITDAFVDWGLRRGNRQRSEWDRAFHMGYVSAAPSSDKIREAEAFWDGQGICSGNGRPIAAFFGTLGRQFDLDTVIAAARRLHGAGNPYQFILCGRGDRAEFYQKLAAGLPNVIFPGWVDAAAIHVLMRRSAVGLDPLPDRYDFLATINNKAIEYFSAGLPVLSSPTKGVLAELLAGEHCGLSYETGNVDALVEIMARLTADPSQLQVLSENCTCAFREKFAAEKVYGQMMRYLEEIAASTAG
jgi:glycosyltransferase involved in cell wall biosynthesis